MNSYVEVATIPIHRAVVQLLEGLCMPGQVKHIIVSRWSRPGDSTNSAEQAAKVLDIHRKLVPAVEELLTCVPSEAWLTEHGRRDHGIVPIRAHHITDVRDPDDPKGNSIIGYLIIFGDAAVFRVAHSGFDSVMTPAGDELNLYAQAVIEIMKWAVAYRPDERIHLRLSEDRSRKGRHGLELGRLDSWLERLGMRMFHGETELDLEGWGKLFSQFDNQSNEEHRTTTVSNLMVGRTRSIEAGHLAMSEANMPPYLCQPYDLDTGKPLRDGSHAITAWFPEVAPALAEYCEAFAAGASPSTLANILIRHRIPTPKPLPPSAQGQPRTSSRRDTTFDQLPAEEARRRAARWLTYADNPVRACAPDAGEEVRSEVERKNRLAIRKFELLRTGRFEFQYRNPTPLRTQYGEFEVQREGRLDKGRIIAEIEFVWPPKRKIVDVDGRPVVSDEVELDEEGIPIPWEHLGVSVRTLDACIERLHDRANGRIAKERTAQSDDGWGRLLTIDRWTTGTGPDARQWDAWKKGNKSGATKHLYRWLLWRPAPNPDDPEWSLNATWDANRTDASKKRGTERWPGRHVATIREPHLVRFAYEALRDASLEALDADVVLEAPDLAERQAGHSRHRQALLDSATEADQMAKEARKAAAGYERAAMIALGDSHESRHDGHMARHDAEKRAAIEFDLEAERLRSDAASLDTTVDAELAVTTLAHLLEVMRLSAENHEGMAPLHVCSLVQELFTNWRFTPQAIGVATTCTARLPLAGGSHALLELSGVVSDTGYGRSCRAPYGQTLIAQLVRGATLDELVARGTRETSREALYVQARKVLGDAGVSTYRAAALLDHPFPPAIQAVWAALTGERPNTQSWTSGFEKHMGATYSSQAWGKSACPTAGMTNIHRIMAVVSQHPAGVDLDALIVAAEVKRKVVLDMINPPQGGKGHRRRPQMLRWLPGKIGIEVQAIACPHRDCTTPTGKRWATNANLLPETAPQPGEIGAVLCPHCRRVPRADMFDIIFPNDWLAPVTRRVEGLNGSVRDQELTGSIDIGPVASIPSTSRTSLHDLAREAQLTPTAAAEVLDAAGIKPTYRGRGRGRTYNTQPAQRALRNAGRNTAWDRMSRNPDALRITAAAIYSGLTKSELRAAVDASEITAYRTGNNQLRFLPADLDALVALRSGGRPPR